MRITEHDEVIEAMETEGVDNPDDILAEIKLDLMTDLMATGNTYSPPYGSNRPNPPGSNYSEADNR